MLLILAVSIISCPTISQFPDIPIFTCIARSLLLTSNDENKSGELKKETTSGRHTSVIPKRFGIKNICTEIWMIG